MNVLRLPMASVKDVALVQWPPELMDNSKALTSFYLPKKQTDKFYVEKFSLKAMTIE